MRSELLPLLLLVAACGGAAQANDPPATPTTSATTETAPPASATTTSPPPASTVATAPPPARAFCPAVGSITFQGGMGTSKSDAIKIVGAKGEMDGVASEYACLDEAFGSRRAGAWKLLRQSLLGENGKNYDLMSIQLADGTKKDILFDISDYFGKF